MTKDGMYDPGFGTVREIAKVREIVLLKLESIFGSKMGWHLKNRALSKEFKLKILSIIVVERSADVKKAKFWIIKQQNRLAALSRGIYGNQME